MGEHSGFVSCLSLDAVRSQVKYCVGRGRDALTAPNRLLVALRSAKHTDHLDWSLPAHRRGTLRGMDAA
ncbi:hypothetical protein E1J25_21490 [Xanthomonas hortorum pv. taraxaci]|nr:hypothetical protein [Xanthomonas hortorum pv. taraxaci]